MSYKQKRHLLDSTTFRFHAILASCPLGPATAHGLGILTEMDVIYMERYTSHRAIHAKIQVRRSIG